MDNKITERDFYNVIADLVEEDATITFEKDGEDVTITGADLADFAFKKISQIDRKNEKAKERNAKKAKEGDALSDIIKSVLTDEFQTGEEITNLVAEKYEGDIEVTKPRVVARLTPMVKDEEVIKESIKIEGVTGKKVAYKLA